MKSKYLIAFLLAALIAILTVIVAASSIGSQIEFSLADTWFRLRGTVTPPRDVVVIAIDEMSYSNLKVSLNQPWPRALHAKLLEKLSAYGVKRVIFDILFLDQGSAPEGDTALERALRTTTVFLGTESAMQQVGGGGGSYTIEELLQPYAPFRSAASGMALVGLPDDNGIVRRFLTDRTERTVSFPSLAEAGAGYTPGDGKPRPAVRDMISYYGAARTIPVISYYQVLEEERPLPAEVFKGKVAFVGLLLRTDIGPAQKDVMQSPLGGTPLFGVEIHATAAANLLQGKWIARPPAWAELTGFFLVTLVVAFLLLLLNPIAGGLILLTFALAWATISFVLFLQGTLVVGLLPVSIVLPCTFLGSTVYYYIVAQRSAKKMARAFEQYLSPEMAAELQRGGSLKVGGEKIWATALFTDIESSTAITEEMPAEKVSEMLNAYFTEVVEVVFRNKGTLIKFIGDAIFALWGAPLRLQNHAELAIKTGLDLEREVRRFNESKRFPPLRTRIGIHTGPMVVGNLGSQKRFDYTAIGDSVNLASRTEGLNKYFGTTVLFTEATRKDAGNTVLALPIGSVQVVGKREVVTLFTSFRDPLASDVEADWLQALDSFRKRNFDAASQLFLGITTREPRLRPTAELYLSRIEEFRAKPPDLGWSGALSFDHK